MSSERIEPAPAALIARTWSERWGGLVVTPERTYHPPDVEGLALFVDDGTFAALVTWALDGIDAEIVTLDALLPGRGYGARALAAAESELASRGVERVHLVTTNDNIVAISLYLRAGYRLTRIHFDSMDRVRALKPEVPLVGENGIRLCDMWELEKNLV